MSADNWAECPKCEIAFLRTRGFTDNPLREDYSIYLDGFILHIRYKCCCEACGFKFALRRLIDTREQEKEDE